MVAEHKWPLLVNLPVLENNSSGYFDIGFKNILQMKDRWVVIITLNMNRQEIHTALCRATALELHDAWSTLRDDDASVGIMTDADYKTFSAGWEASQPMSQNSHGFLMTWSLSMLYNYSMRHHSHQRTMTAV